MSRLGRQRERHPRSEASKISVCEKPSGLSRGPCTAHPRCGFPAVGNNDRIAIQCGCDIVRHSGRMNWTRIGIDGLVEAMTRCSPQRAQTLEPLVVPVEFLTPRCLDRLAQKLAAVGNDP